MLSSHSMPAWRTVAPAWWPLPQVPGGLWGPCGEAAAQHTLSLPSD